MILALVNMGEVFGEMAFFDEGERNEFATALDDCLVCAINKNEFKEFVDRNPELNLRITKLIGLKLKKYSERIEELVFKDAEQRLVSFLLRLADENGKQIEYPEQWNPSEFMTLQPTQVTVKIQDRNVIVRSWCYNWESPFGGVTEPVPGYGKVVPLAFSPIKR